MRLPTPRATLTVLLLIVGLFAFSVAAVAQESVDFSKAPAAGLKYKVVSKTTGEISRTMSAGERTMSMTIKQERASTYTDTILEVKDGKIRKMEREYEDLVNKQAVEMEGREPREMEGENPLAWKHFRVEWDDEGAATVKVKDDDEWADPEDDLKKALRPKRLRRSVFPLPREAKSIGDTWELSEKDIDTYFPKPRVRSRDGGEGPEIDRELTGSLQLTEITNYREMKCAVIKANFEIKMEVGEMGTSTTKQTQTCYYSLEHRIVVGVKVAIESTSKSSREMGGVTREQEGSTKVTGEVVVTVEQAGKAEEAGE